MDRTVKLGGIYEVTDEPSDHRVLKTVKHTTTRLRRGAKKGGRGKVARRGRGGKEG